MKHLNKKFYLWFLVIVSGLVYLLLYTLYPKAGSTANFIDYIKPIPAVVFIDTIISFVFVKFLWKWKYFFPSDSQFSWTEQYSGVSVMLHT